MKVTVVFDDTGKKSEVISDIIGDKGFADVVVKKRRLEEYYRDELKKEYPELNWQKLHSLFEFADLSEELEYRVSGDMRILHCFSDFLISDPESARLTFRKLNYVDKPYAVFSEKKAVAAMFPSVQSYLSFCREITAGKKPRELVREFKDSCEIEGLVDIGKIGNFIQCVTGNFDSRYFNSLKGNEYTIVKSSANKDKIRAEYKFYHLLPEDMKYWFVMPFDHKETADEASYTMERLHMTDLAIKWVHGSMDEAEFEELMDKYFYFFSCRHEKKCSKEEYKNISDALYVKKVKDRIAALKAHKDYKKIESLLAATGSDSIDTLAERYFALKEKIEKKCSYPLKLVIGHGDPCFANALYNKSTKTLKFIDPRGALSEEELWTDPYYDVAKLSHSVCGSYDFFNNALFDIHINESFSAELEIPFDNTVYVEIFKKRLEQSGFDWLSVRLYEASLFLSMLPLHMDNPLKVLGFILNVKKLLEEIEKDV
ncbi:MAG: hypothetical protein IKR23_12530 [Lachnospiraceae bacterium]|nr:hypothetical protein [Lachnospiraceae bacterium]